MSNPHRLPEPVPEGWYEEERPFDRFRSWKRNGTHDLRVVLWDDGHEALHYVTRDDGTCDCRTVALTQSLPEACAAAERAFCGCYVKAVVKWESAP